MAPGRHVFRACLRFCIKCQSILLIYGKENQKGRAFWDALSHILLHFDVTRSYACATSVFKEVQHENNRFFCLFRPINHSIQYYTWFSLFYFQSKLQAEEHVLSSKISIHSGVIDS